MSTPPVAMAAILWVGMAFCCLIVVSQTQTAQPTLKAEKVYISRNLCGSTLGVGSPLGNWKRLSFSSNTTCQRKFRCHIDFKLTGTDPLSSDVCVDYSRVKIQGSKSFVKMRGGITENPVRERLTETRYPLIEPYMNQVLCISKEYELRLSFLAACDQPLDQSFAGWLYVYVQSVTTGSIYFVDGGVRHRHKMSDMGQPRVSLRSHMWSDPPPGSPVLSTMRLSVVKDSGWDSSRVCLEWNPSVRPRFPRGMRLMIIKSYFNMDKALSTYASVGEGERVNATGRGQKCHNLHNNREIVLEVRRDTDVVWDWAWSETELLFDLVVGVNNQGDVVFSISEEKSTSTLPPEDNVDEELTSPSFWEKHKLLICLALGGLGLLILLYCCCRSKQSNGSPDPTGIEDDPDDIMGSGSLAGEPTTFPMMSRNTPSPYTRRFGADESSGGGHRNPDNIIGSDTSSEEEEGEGEPGSIHVRTRVAPSAPNFIEAVDNAPGDDGCNVVISGPPPSYQDLFPDRKDGNV